MVDWSTTEHSGRAQRWGTTAGRSVAAKAFTQWTEAQQSTAVEHSSSTAARLVVPQAAEKAGCMLSRDGKLGWDRN